MSDALPILVVAIVNTSEELSAMLAAVFRMEGFRTVVAYIPDLKRGQPSIEAFLAQNRPHVVVWDIAIPYEENWAFFQTVSQSEIGQRYRFVLTTTNKAALERLVGETPAHELVGKPFDIDEIVAAVRRAVDR